jgi:PAS domain S-box-containing protein
MQDILTASREELIDEVRSLRAALAARDAGLPAAPEFPAPAQLLERVSDAIIITDCEQRIHLWNQAAERLYGWHQHEVLGRSLAECVPIVRYLNGCTPELTQQDLARQGSWRGELVQHTRDGSELVIDETIQLTYANGGQVVGYVIFNRDITARHRAEAALRASEERFAKAFRASPAALVIVHRASATIVDCNESYQRLLGYSRAELIGERLTKLGIYTSQGDRDEILQAVRSQSEIRARETTLHTKSGETREVLLSADALAIDGDEYILSTMFDITDHKQAELALRTSEERFRILFEHAPDAVVLVDPHHPTAPWSIVDCNNVLCRMNGYSRAELVGQPIDILNPQPDTLESQHNYIAMLKQTGSMQYETFHRHKDGHLFPIEVITSIVTIAGRELVLGIDRDISERKRTESALRAAEARYRTLVEQIPAIIYTAVIDEVSGTSYVSPQIEDILGFSPEEWLSDPELWLKQVHPDDRAAVLSDVALVQSSDLPHSLEYRAYTRDGRLVWLYDSARMVRDEAGQALFMQGITMDITERKRAEQRSLAFAALGRQLSSASTAEEAARTIAKAADELLGWDAFLMNLYSAEHDTVRYVLAYDIVGGQRAETALPELFSPSPISRRVFTEGAFLILRDHEQLERERYHAFGDENRPSASMLYVPIRHGDTPIGLISIQSYALNAYTEEDLSTLQSLADHCSGAIQRLRIAESLRESEHMYKLIWMSTNDAMAISDPGGTVLDANPAFLQLYGQPIGAVAGHSFARFLPEEQDYSQSFLSRPTGQLFEHTVARADGAERVVESRLDFLEQAGQRQAMLAIVRDITERKRADQALAEERALLAQRVAERTADLSAANAGLRFALERVQALYTITNTAIMSEALSEALEYAIERVRVTLGADHVVMLLFDWPAQRIQHVAYCGRDTGQPYTDAAFAEFMDGLTGWAVRERRPAISPKGQLDPREGPEAQRHRSESNCGAVAVVPLYYHDEVFGTITASNQLDQPDFTDEDVELMVAVAGQLAMAYAHNQLTERVRQANRELQAEIAERTQLEEQIRRGAKRDSALAALSRKLAEAGREKQLLFDMIARQTTESLGEGCIVTLISDDGAFRQVVAIDHRDPAVLAFLRQNQPAGPIPTGQGIVGQVLSTGQALLIPEVPPEIIRAEIEPPAWADAEQLGLTSMMIVPMRARGRLIGAINTVRNQPDQPFTPADQAFLQDLADRAGLALENARLFASVEQSRIELARAARLKDEFLASMSHELRTPLNAILGRSEVLGEQIYGPLNARQLAALHSIEESGRHLLALINDILDLSKIEAGKLTLDIETLVVDDMCRASLRMVAQSALAKQITLVSSLDPVVDIIQADVRRLKQILVNLLSNAVKFTPKGGQVGLDVRGDVERQTVTFTIWDTGIGIAEADLPKLFQTFVQIDSSLSRQYEGTGLGLALVRRLTEAHGGSVSVTSTPGQGSRFSVTLAWMPTLIERVPMLSVPAISQPIHDAPPRDPNAPAPVILLAEDRPENITMLLEYLPAKGYQVVPASNGAEAIERAFEHTPALILMDIQMPGMDGLEAIRRIRADTRLRATPIIALTALAMPGDRERCLHAGADEYLVKPINLRALLSTIQAQLQSRAA